MHELKGRPQLSEICFLIFQDEENAQVEYDVFYFLNKTSAENSAYKVHP